MKQSPRMSRWLWLLLGVGLAILLGGGYVVYALVIAAAKPAEPPPPAEAASSEVHRFCGICHRNPPPDTFPRALWRDEIKQAYAFFRDSPFAMPAPSLESVALYYEHRAPAELPPVPLTRASPCPIGFAPTHFDLPDRPAAPGVTNVNLVHLFDDHKLDVLVCDARLGQVLALKAYEDPPRWVLLGKTPCPAHAEVMDLDGDGIKDILVADLGRFTATDDRVGSVVWIQGLGHGKFAPPVTLLRNVGRVADVQAADFAGTGRLDLVVAVFGWRETGEILLLHNRTTDWSRPRFVPEILDDRHGTIHVPVADIDGDGRPDFVALISQEHETIVAFLNQGGGRFRKRTIYTADHPAYGSSGIQLVDLNGDGKIDVLYTNGDSLQQPFLLKPYHGIQWLENRGRFPFVHHPLASLYGAERAVAADFSGHGRVDIMAVSYLPPASLFPARREQDLDSILFLEQTAPGHFRRHALETNHCDHLTCAAGDIFGDGKVHLVTGNFSLNARYRLPHALTIYRNLGPTRK